jgi:hypothetical protein
MGMNIQIVPNITHNKPMPYIVHHGTVNQPQDALARRGSTSSVPASPEVAETVATKVSPVSPTPSAYDRLGGILHELEKVAARVQPSSYSHLPPDHEVPQMIALIASLTSQLGVGPTPTKLEATAFLVQRILSRLFDKSMSTPFSLFFLLPVTLLSRCFPTYCVLISIVWTSRGGPCALVLYHHYLSCPVFS